MQPTRPNAQLSADFLRVPLAFEPGTTVDVFGGKNNKTVEETLAHPRYSKLRGVASARFPERPGEPLGRFLLSLKRAGDESYRRFLNRYGDLEYCAFRISDPPYLDLKGVYAYFLGEKLVYVGRCKDSLKRRVNQGYGKIHPKNCFLDDQATIARRFKPSPLPAATPETS